VRHEASRPSVVETPNTAGEIMTKDVVSVLVGSRVRDVAILLLKKRISAVPVLAANLELLGMVSEGDLMGRSDTDRVARRDWWLTLLKDFQPQTETIAALAARPVEQVMCVPVLTIEARAPLHEIAEMLKVHDIKRLPVMQGDRMVGIVSRSDLVRAMAHPDTEADIGEIGRWPALSVHGYDAN
jgi:CBS domain-containing protein